MAGKRKRTSRTGGDDRGKHKKKDTAPSKQIRTSRLIELPPELRNRIYLHVLDNEPVFLRSTDRNKVKTTHSGALTCKSALARVNRQVRKELTSLARTASSILIADVKNFDFGPIITFFNKLDELDLKALPTIKVENRQRDLIINLIHDGPMSFDKGVKGLTRWLNRLEDPYKQGADVVVTYRWDSVGSMANGMPSVGKLRNPSGYRAINHTARQAAALDTIKLAAIADRKS